MRRRTMLWTGKGHTNAALREVDGFPVAITNWSQYTEFPPCTTPTTVDQAMEFQKRAIEATIDIHASNGGGSTVQTMQLYRYKHSPITIQINQHEENKLISGYGGPFIWKPEWFGQLN